MPRELRRIAVVAWRAASIQLCHRAVPVRVDRSLRASAQATARALLRSLESFANSRPRRQPQWQNTLPPELVSRSNMRTRKTPLDRIEIRSRIRRALIRRFPANRTNLAVPVYSHDGPVAPRRSPFAYRCKGRNQRCRTVLPLLLRELLRVNFHISARSHRHFQGLFVRCSRHGFRHRRFFFPTAAEAWKKKRGERQDKHSPVSH